METLIAINGGIVGTLVVIIPAFIHLKCMYIDKNCGQILN
jgi:hypothetical protein